MSAQRIDGIVLIVGSILFMIAAFSPVSRIFGLPDAAQKLEIIMAERGAWTVSQVLFSLGALVTAVALILTWYHFRSLPSSGWAFAGVAAIAVGALFWSWSVYLRGADPQAFVEGTLPGWPFVAYSILTQAGLVMVGLLLLRTGLPGWVGWVDIGGAVFFFVAMIIFRDMPPFVYYILTLLTGVMLYRL